MIQCYEQKWEDGEMFDTLEKAIGNGETTVFDSHEDGRWWRFTNITIAREEIFEQCHNIVSGKRIRSRYADVIRANVEFFMLDPIQIPEYEEPENEIPSWEIQEPD